jgi:hypothetical protein
MRGGALSSFRASIRRIHKKDTLKVPALWAEKKSSAHELRPLTETIPRQAIQGLSNILALSSFLTSTGASALGNGGMDGIRTEFILATEELR